MKCPVCQEELNQEPRVLSGSVVRFSCANCGTFDTSDVAHILIDGLGQNPIERALLSYSLQKMQMTGTPYLNESLLQKIFEKPLPALPEQCDNLVLWLGENLSFPGHRVWIKPQTHRSVLGAVNAFAFGQVIRHLVKRNLICSSHSPKIPSSVGATSLRVA
jgi:hypothetical protein